MKWNRWPDSRGITGRFGVEYAPATPEDRIELFGIDQYLGDNQENIKQLIIRFRSNESFIYLNKLRNLMQHRRLPLMVSVGTYNTDWLDTIKPKSIRSLATIKLPKNLDYFDDTQINNSFSVQILQIIEGLYNKTEEFVLEIYKNINP